MHTVLHTHPILTPTSTHRSRKTRLSEIATLCRDFNAARPPPRSVSAHQAIIFKVPLSVHPNPNPYPNPNPNPNPNYLLQGPFKCS